MAQSWLWDSQIVVKKRSLFCLFKFYKSKSSQNKNPSTGDGLWIDNKRISGIAIFTCISLNQTTVLCLECKCRHSGLVTHFIW